MALPPLLQYLLFGAMFGLVRKVHQCLLLLSEDQEGRGGKKKKEGEEEGEKEERFVQ